MAKSKKHILNGRSFKLLAGGTIHPGATGDLDQFKEWLGEETFERAMKAKSIAPVPKADDKPKGKPGPKPKADADDGNDGNNDAKTDGDDKPKTGLTAGATRTGD